MFKQFPGLMFADDGADGGGDEKPEGQEQTFTQADVDRLVGTARQDERRKASAKFADYDDLKAKADGAKTVEERLAQVEARAKDAEARALRSDIANRHGISAEDRDLFLTGADEATLEAQAKRLAQRAADEKRRGGGVRREGGNRTGSDKDGGMREFTRSLFGNND